MEQELDGCEGQLNQRQSNSLNNAGSFNASSGIDDENGGQLIPVTDFSSQNGTLVPAVPVGSSSEAVVKTTCVGEEQYVDLDIPSAISLLAMHRRQLQPHQQQAQVTQILRESSETAPVTSISSIKAGSSSGSNGVSVLVGTADISATGNSPKLQQVLELLDQLNLASLKGLFVLEHITIDVLAEMGHQELKQVGVHAYGHRHKIIKGRST